MAEGRVPDAVDMFAQEAVCPTTDRGWLWYCDPHDTHGNTDSQDEADLMAAVHVEYWGEVTGEDECDVVVWQRTGHERIGGGG